MNSTCKSMKKHAAPHSKIMGLGLENLKDQMAEAYARGMEPEKIWEKFSAWAGVHEDYLRRKIPMKVVREHIRTHWENT